MKKTTPEGRGDTGWLRSLCRDMPKAELHMHLDGAVAPETALAVARAEGLGLFRPPTYQTAYEQLVVRQKLASQKQLLQYYALSVQLLQSRAALERVTYELLRDKAADAVQYCEIRFAPALHTSKGLAIGDVMQSVLKAKRCAEKRFGVVSTLIVVGLRTAPLAENLAMLRAVAPYVGGGKVVAVDFAGVEGEAPDPTHQTPFFELARAMGLHVTLHCGELPGSQDMLARVVEKLNPDRIAHGAGAVESPALCRLLQNRGIMLDLCPTSNMQAGLYKDYASYPLARLCQRGVPVSISTDSPRLSGRTLGGEYAGALVDGGLLPAQLWHVNRDAVRHSFAPPATKTALLERFDRWAAHIPELHS